LGLNRLKRSPQLFDSAHAHFTQEHVIARKTARVTFSIRAIRTSGRKRIRKVNSLTESMTRPFGVIGRYFKPFAHDRENILSGRAVPEHHSIFEVFLLFTTTTTTRSLQLKD
jgi:hypothetical protein